MKQRYHLISLGPWAVCNISFCCIFFNWFDFYWRIIVLQNFAVFHQTSTSISHSCPLPIEPPSYLPPHPTPLGWSRAPVWVSWDIQQISPWPSISHMVMSVPCYSFHTSHPLLPSPHVQKSILSVCFFELLTYTFLMSGKLHDAPAITVRSMELLPQDFI